MTSEEAITLEKRGRVAIVRLNKPSKLNALTQDDYFQLAVNLHAIAADDEIYITVLTGKGRFFSAGADFSVSKAVPEGEDPKHYFLKTFVANNLHLTRAFYSHPKILITALNGPAIGLSAALVAFSDFVYAARHSYLLTPFSSIGLVAEGSASVAFVQRLGISKANEALLMSRKLKAEDLVAVGFVNKIFNAPRPEDDEEFTRLVLAEIDEMLGPQNINQESLLRIKALIRAPQRQSLDAQGVAEVFGGLDRFVAGVPQKEFERLAKGEKRHKL